MTTDQRVKFWDAINRYVSECGGDPSRHISTARMTAVAEVEKIVRNAEDDVPALRAALEGIRPFVAEDFPVGPDGRVDWSAFPVTFGYAKAYRAVLVALGREP